MTRPVSRPVRRRGTFHVYVGWFCFLDGVRAMWGIPRRNTGVAGVFAHCYGVHTLFAVDQKHFERRCRFVFIMENQ